MNDMLTLGQMLTVHARVLGEASGARDLERAMSFRQWNERSCRLGNALLGLGLAKGDRVAVLAYNCVEWLEIFAATAKAGLDRAADQLPAHQRRRPLHCRECRGHGTHRPGRAPGHRRGGPRGPAGAGRQPDPFRQGALPRRLPRLRGADRCRQRPRAGAAGGARRPLDAHVHLGHHGQAQGRAAQPSGGRAAVPVHRDRAWPAPSRRCPAGHADVPRQLAQLLRRLRLLRRRDGGLLAQELRPRARRADAGGRRLDLHLAGADPLHHDAGPARGGRGAVGLQPRHQADDLLRSGAPGHQARGHGDVSQLRPVRALRLERGRLGHHAPPARAVHQAGLGRARMRRLGADQDPRRERQRGAGRRVRRALFFAIPTRSTATGSCRRKPRRHFAASTARSATWPAATRTATSSSSTARAT